MFDMDLSLDEETIKALVDDNLTEYLASYIPEINGRFGILKSVGEGAFSSVYLANVTGTDQFVALKHIVPTTAPRRSETEILCLQKFRGLNHVIGITAAFRSKDHVVLILPYLEHEKFQDYYLEMTRHEIRDYMFHLFAALKHIHRHNIIHRDVKPNNFLYSRKEHKYALIDFGLAMQVPGQESFLSQAPKKQRRSASTSTIVKPSTRMNYSQMNPVRLNMCHLEHAADQVCTACMTRSNQTAPRAGTAGYRPPEVLLKCPNQGTGVDIWAAGMIFFSLLSGRYPPLKASDDMEALCQMVVLLGHERLGDAAKSLGKLFTCTFDEEPASLKDLCICLRKHRCPRTRGSLDVGLPRSSQPCPFCLPNSAYDLLEKCLDPNPLTRISATAAQEHPFFNRQTYARTSTC